MVYRIVQRFFSTLIVCPLIFFSLSPAWAAQKNLDSNGQNDDFTKAIEGLLNDAEGALLGNHEPVSQPRRATKKRRAPTAATPQPAPIVSQAPKAQLETVPQLAPIDSIAIQKVIAIDLEASQREREPIYPITKVQLSFGLHDLKPVYSLTKDDDYFTNTQGGNIKGLYLTFSPIWKIGFLETSFLRPFFSVVVATGYSQGELLMQRTGIQTGNQNYGVKLFPVDAGVQLTFEFWRRVGIFAGYGPGVEVLHQDGLLVNDSITDLFYGDELWVGLSGKISPSVELLIGYKKKGTNLLFRSQGFGGQILSAGVGFGLSG